MQTNEYISRPPKIVPLYHYLYRPTTPSYTLIHTATSSTSLRVMLSTTVHRLWEDCVIPSEYVRSMSV